MIRLKRQRLIWQLMGVFLPKTKPPTTKPAKKELRGLSPKNLLSSRQAALQKKTKVPSFLPCSHAFLKIALIVLELKDLKRNTMTREWTNLTLPPYSSPLRSPLSKGLTSFQAASILIIPPYSANKGMLRGLLRGNLLLRQAFNTKPKSKFRNTSEYIKKKKEQEEKQDTSETSLEQIKESHRLLYLQLIPLPIVLTPLAYFVQEPSQALFLSACNGLQYYTSGWICFNAFMNEANQKKFYGLMMGVAVANGLSGPYSISAPLILGTLNLLLPFTDEKMHRVETETQQENAKIYMRLQGTFYFVIVVLTSCKCYHYLSLLQMQGNIKRLQEKSDRLGHIQ